MSEVLDTQEYIIEPGTKIEDVISFFPTVHWSVHRATGLAQFIEWSDANNQYFKVFLKDNVPYVKRLKEVGDGQTN